MRKRMLLLTLFYRSNPISFLKVFPSKFILSILSYDFFSASSMVLPLETTERTLPPLVKGFPLGPKVVPAWYIREFGISSSKVIS